MGFFNRKKSKDDIERAIEVLAELQAEYPFKSYTMIRTDLEEGIKKHSDELRKIFQEGMNVENWAHTSIVNLSGDYLESGKYHMYRGVLQKMGPGEDLLQLYDRGVDNLISIGSIDETRGAQEKKAIRDNIKNVG
jgi:hypothetical protein